MNPVQYIIVNQTAFDTMSKGKATAQGGHASVMGLLAAHTQEAIHNVQGARRNPFDASIVNRWLRGGHYAKVTLAVPDERALFIAERYVNDRGFKTALIIDEGRTEIDPQTPTCFGTGVVDKDSGHVQDTFGEFSLYREPKPAETLAPRWRPVKGWAWCRVDR